MREDIILKWYEKDKNKKSESIVISIKWEKREDWIPIKSEKEAKWEREREGGSDGESQRGVNDGMFGIFHIVKFRSLRQV